MLPGLDVSAAGGERHAAVDVLRHDVASLRRDLQAVAAGHVDFVGDPDAIGIARARHLPGERNAGGCAASSESELLKPLAGGWVAGFRFDAHPVTHLAMRIGENANVAGIGGECEAQAVFAWGRRRCESRKRAERWWQALLQATTMARRRRDRARLRGAQRRRQERTT